MKTKEDIVGRFVKNHSLLDKHLAEAYKAAARMAKDAEEGIKLGMIDKALDAKSFLAKHRALAGLVASAADAGAELHITGTAIATANGADLGSVASVGGVPFPQPEMSTFGGGGR